MKKVLAALSLSLLTFVAIAQDKETLYKTVPLVGQGISAVDIQTSGGSITVLAASKGSERLEVILRRNGSKELSEAELKSRLEDNYTLSIDVQHNKLLVRVDPKRKDMDWRNSVSVSFRAYVPAQAATMLMTSGGSITVKGLSGGQKVMTSGGSITMDNVKGSIDGKTSGGSLTITNSTAKGQLLTSGGSITASNLDGEFSLRTSGGSITLNDLKGKIEATTSGGSVTGRNISGFLTTATSGGSMKLTELSCTLDASTSAGTLQASFNSIGDYVQLRNSSGNILLSVPANTSAKMNLQSHNVSVPKLSNFSGDITDKNVSGNWNGGGALISAKATNGKITLEVK